MADRIIFPDNNCGGSRRLGLFLARRHQNCSLLYLLLSDFSSEFEGEHTQAGLKLENKQDLVFHHKHFYNPLLDYSSQLVINQRNKQPTLQWARPVPTHPSPNVLIRNSRPFSHIHNARTRNPLIIGCHFLLTKHIAGISNHFWESLLIYIYENFVFREFI